MNRLANTRAYLCGAMDRVPDAGVVWRRSLIQNLHHLKIQWFDPTNKPIQMGKEDDESRRLRRIAKTDGKFAVVIDEMHPIRAVDKRMVHICDWMVVNIDTEVHACGTYDELFKAAEEDKPVLVHCEQGKVNAPDWLFDALPPQHIFGTWSNLEAYICHIAHDDVIDDLGKWMWFDWMGEA